MYDINSPSESTRIISKLLMRWSEDGDNLHIHTVLHLNKGDDNTRGHIGTELNNKAETVLQITKSQQDGNISEVKAMHIRDREFDPFAFRINDNALPEIVEGYKPEARNREDRKRKSLTLTGTSPNNSTASHWKRFSAERGIWYKELENALIKSYMSSSV